MHCKLFGGFPATSYPFLLCLKKTNTKQSLLEVTRKTSQKVNTDLSVGLRVEVVMPYMCTETHFYAQRRQLLLRRAVWPHKNSHIKVQFHKNLILEAESFVPQKCCSDGGAPNGDTCWNGKTYL